ncbi:MAG: anti-sigma factor family protein [Mycobacteriales bacterium]
MNEHDRELLGAYTLGVLDGEEEQAVREHLAGCASCRADQAELAAMREALGEVPPEAFLDGPPEGGDLLLQRTLRQVRAEKARQGRRGGALAVAGVALIAAAALGAGVLLGHGTAGSRTAEPSSSPSPSPSPVASASPTPAGTRVLTATDPASGARITATLVPAAGWVRVHASVSGIPAGKRCQLLVLPRDGGTPVLAGSWLVSPKGAQAGTELDGTALVAPADVGAVQVSTVEGQRLVTVQA